MEQRSDESAEVEVRDLDAKLPPPPTPADLGGGRIRPAALVRWGFFAGVGLLLAYGAAQALLSVRNLLVLVLVAMFLAVSLDPAVRWLTARGLPRGLAVTLILVVLVAILAAHQPSTGRQPPGMLRWLRRGGDQAAEVPGGLAVATQQANRAHDRERKLRQHEQHRDGWLEANAHLGPQYRQVVRALAWQRRATGLAVEADQPGYVLEALGPVPESTRGRRVWRQAAAEIEQYRRTYQITDPDRALGPGPRDLAQRADRQLARTAIERVHTKQRAADRSRDAQSISERPSPPRPHQQRGRPGPERAAG